MRVMVTGADGFIGSHLVEALLAREGTERVYALVHDPRIKWLPRDGAGRLEVVVGDVTRPARLSRVGEVDAVVHLAALASVGLCERRPEEARMTNFQGTVNLLNWALERSPHPTFVHVSTAALYGEPQYLPIDEDHPLDPTNHYTYTKLSAELTVQAYNVNEGLPTVMVRPFNIYGPRQPADFLVPTIVIQCLQGIELRLGDGRPVRSVTYVSDAVDCLIRCATVEAARGRVFNLGSRETHRVSGLAEKVVDLTGCGLEPVYDPAKFREGEPTSLEMDPSLAEGLLGWRPRVGVHDGLRRTIEHYRAGVEEEKRRVAEELYGKY